MGETQLESSTTAAELKIDVTLIAKLNLADFQNAVPSHESAEFADREWRDIWALLHNSGAGPSSMSELG